jgi:ribonuclease-3
MEDETLREFEKVLQYKFSNASLLEQAMKHASSADARVDSNERMEFLGDAVLNLAICRSLFDLFPDYLEGDMTKVKSMLVSRRTCARVAKNIGLESWMTVSKGISGTRGFEGSIAAGMVEALIAAIYIDGGYDEASRFILRVFGPYIDLADAEQHQENYKSVLQQYAQQELHASPIYQLLDEKGPDHNKCFEVGVTISQKHYPSAWGINKKEAEQLAAYNALMELGVLTDESKQ